MKPVDAKMVRDHMKTIKEWFQDVANDSDLEEDIRAELAYDLTIGRVGGVDVSVEGGMVTLTGTVYSLAQKWAVEHAVRRVAGVNDLVNDLRVDPPKDVSHSDEEIASAAATVLEWTAGVPDGIDASVKDGLVTLDGTVAVPSDRLAADEAVRRLVGVKDVDNRLVTASADAADDLRGSIEAAIRRRTGGLGITVGYDDGTVTLEGVVRAWAVRSRAEEAARVSPGVKEVVNRIAVVDHTAEAGR